MNKTNILEYLEETAGRFPDKTAFSDGSQSISFAELHRKAEAIGSFLISNGIRRQAVAVLMDKHPDTVCAFLGALYAGCFYVCINTDMPDERIRDLAELSRAGAVICNEKSADKAHVLYGRTEIFLFDEMTEGIIDRDALCDVRKKAIDTDPAYIVFTSGSTGEAKGVCASHRSVIDYAEALCRTLGFDFDTVFGNQAPLYYDAPLKEILPTLCLGATVCFIPKELFMFPSELCEYIRDQGINTLCWAASAFASISAFGALDSIDMSFLKKICFGSEVFPVSEYKKWRAACKDAEFINLYGPTEATGMSCYWIADRELGVGEDIPIGKPFPNTDILLIGESGEEVSYGDIGEIYIRGGCLAHGYFGNICLTDASFVQNHLNNSFPERIYRTGDMAKMNDRGELVYIGRRDRQIKLMGRRIELAEIERAAAESPGIYFASAVFDDKSMRITLFYTGELESSALLRHLSIKLPRYMLPKKCMQIDMMPHLPNGKLDRAKLVEMMEKNNEKTYAASL